MEIIARIRQFAIMNAPKLSLFAFVRKQPNNLLQFWFSFVVDATHFISCSMTVFTY